MKSLETIIRRKLDSINGKIAFKHIVIYLNEYHGKKIDHNSITKKLKPKIVYSFLETMGLNSMGSNSLYQFASNSNHKAFKGVEWQKEVSEAFLKRRVEKVERLLKKKRNSKKNNPKIKKYYEYLRSKEWAAIRKMAFDKYGKSCCRCEEKKTLEVHHTTYKNIFNEKLEDLEVVCKPCHIKIHRKEISFKKKTH